MPYISELDVSTSGAEAQQLQKEGFRKVRGNLDEGIRGSRIFLWYKEDKEKSAAITRLQVSFNREMNDRLINAGYKKICKNLNGVEGRPIYLWYFKGSGEYHTPIVDISVTTDDFNEAAKFGFGWERVACDLNRGAGGNWIHLWLKREKQTYISDVKVTDSYELDSDYLKAGYTRVDENTNRGAAGGSPIFIWYLPTTDPECAINDLKVSINENQQLEFQNNYQSVSVNLNEGTGGNKVYLWYNKGSTGPIRSITILVNTDLAAEYEKAGVTVIKEDLNTENCGRIMYLCYTK